MSRSAAERVDGDDYEQLIGRDLRTIRAALHDVPRGSTGLLNGLAKLRAEPFRRTGSPA